MDRLDFYNKILIKPNRLIKNKTVSEVVDNTQHSKNIYNKPKDPKNYKKIGKIDKIFDNETVFLIAGGPSLKGFDFNILKNKNTIAINKAFLFCNHADVIYWTDTRFYTWYESEINDFKGLKVTNKNKPLKNDIINLRDTGRTGLELDSKGLRHGNNSGYAAINLAYHTGAKNIILLGYDMGHIGNSSHFHEGYKNIRHNPKIYENNMLPNFDTIKQPLLEKGINVWNTNKNSKLKCFPFCTIEEALYF